ncbi:hypothetical protein [Streptomyces sp. NPDC002851]
MSVAVTFPVAARRLVRSAAGRRALHVTLFLGGLLALGLFFGGQAHAADGSVDGAAGIVEAGPDKSGELRGIARPFTSKAPETPEAPEVPAGSEDLGSPAVAGSWVAAAEPESREAAAEPEAPAAPKSSGHVARDIVRLLEPGAEDAAQAAEVMPQTPAMPEAPKVPQRPEAPGMGEPRLPRASFPGQLPPAPEPGTVPPTPVPVDHLPVENGADGHGGPGGPDALDGQGGRDGGRRGAERGGPRPDSAYGLGAWLPGSVAAEHGSAGGERSAWHSGALPHPAPPVPQQPFGVTCQSAGDGGSQRHGDAHAVTFSGAPSFRLLPGEGASAGYGPVRDRHRDILEFPG